MKGVSFEKDGKAVEALATLGDAYNGLLQEAQSILPDMVAIRREVHRRPEIGLDTSSTQGLVVNELRKLGLEPKLGTKLASVCATIGSKQAGPTTLLRADMDALPLPERSELEFSSEIDGQAHACGHDLHIASLLGAARLLISREADLHGPVHFVFQPGEEGHFGARLMIDEGLLENIDPSTARAFAVHVFTRYPTGEVHIRPGPLMASSDNFSIRVTGRGGHGSTPHLAIDPITTAAQIIIGLQVAMTREISVADPAVVSICQIEAGSAYNVMPDTARLGGTYRTLSASSREAISELVTRIATRIASAHGAEASVAIEPHHPVTINDDTVTSELRTLVADLLGPNADRLLPAPVMGAEDFSYILQRIPGCMAFVGARPSGAPADGYPDNHSSKVVFDEDAMAIGAALYAGFPHAATRISG